MKKFLLLLGLVVLPLPAIAGDSIRIDDVLGGNPEVKLLRKGRKSEEKAKKAAVLSPGDEVETGPRQILVLSNPDGSKWKVAPNTRLRLEATSSDSSTRVLSLLKGSFWGLAPHDDRKPDLVKLKVKTQTAAMGVRGTEYLMEDREGVSAIDVLKGEVLWGNSDGFEPGSYVLVKEGYRSEIRRNQYTEAGDILKPSEPAEQKAPAAILVKYYGLDLSAESTKKHVPAPPAPMASRSTKKPMPSPSPVIAPAPDPVQAPPAFVVPAPPAETTPVPAPAPNP